MLPLRKGLCDLCNDGKEKELISGVCQMHYWRAHRSGSPICRTRPNFSTPTAQDLEQENWYDSVISNMGDRCWECSALVATWNRKYAKAAVAHILPKEFFPSIKTHPFNFLILAGPCGCHHRWDAHSENAVKMKVFPIALERFQQFYPEIALAERRRIPKIFFNSVKVWKRKNGCAPSPTTSMTRCYSGPLMESISFSVAYFGGPY